MIGTIFHGSSNRLSPVHDVEKLDKQEHVFCGKLISLALWHVCPGPHNLCVPVAETILGTPTSNFQIEDVPEYYIQEKVKAIVQAKPDDPKNSWIPSKNDMMQVYKGTQS